MAPLNSAIGMRNWRRQLDQTYGMLDRIWRCRTQDEICKCFLGFACKFGATHVLAGIIPPPRATRHQQLSHVLLDAWPEQWSRRYFSNGYLYHDPTIRLVSQGSSPFFWNEVGGLCSPNPLSRRVMDEAADFRLSDGLTMAFSTLERQVIGFSFAGEKLELDAGDRLAAQLFASCALGYAITLTTSRRGHEPVQLSPRQHDVLRWAAEGLTVSEIAECLKISINTADTHLRAVRERLGVTSTIQAVAKAFRLGLIT